ncbi:MAG: recombinase family protein [Oligoflexales bacterium]
MGYRNKWLPKPGSRLTPSPLPEIPVSIDFNAYPFVSDKDFLHLQYVVNQKSTKQIARELGCARSTVSKYLADHEIEIRTGDTPGQRKGQTGFGEKVRNGKVVPHLGELALLDKLQEMRDRGVSYGELVTWLNQNGIKTKNGLAKWDRPTIYKILQRNVSRLDNK